MQRPALAPSLAIVLVGGFVLFLGDMTGALFEDHGPFFRQSVPEEWVETDGTSISNPTEALVLFQDTLLLIRAYDASTPPELRSALLAKTLNKLVRETAEGTAPHLTTYERPDSQVAFGVYLERPSVGRDTLLIQVTYEDVRLERSLGDTTATIVTLAERWREALATAFRQIADSTAGRTNPTASVHPMTLPMDEPS